VPYTVSASLFEEMNRNVSCPRKDFKAASLTGRWKEPRQHLQMSPLAAGTAAGQGVIRPAILINYSSATVINDSKSRVGRALERREPPMKPKTAATGSIAAKAKVKELFVTSFGLLVSSLSSSKA